MHILECDTASQKWCKQIEITVTVLVCDMPSNTCTSTIKVMSVTLILVWASRRLSVAPSSYCNYLFNQCDGGMLRTPTRQAPQQCSDLCDAFNVRQLEKLSGSSSSTIGSITGLVTGRHQVPLESFAPIHITAELILPYLAYQSYHASPAHATMNLLSPKFLPGSLCRHESMFQETTISF